MCRCKMEPLYVNLSVLSKLQEGERLQVRNGRFFHLRRDGFTLPDFIVRWWSGSSRHSDFRALQDVFHLAFEHLERLERKTGEEARADAVQLLLRLRASETGLNVFQRTYAGDVTLCARIERLRELVRTKTGGVPASSVESKSEG